jgi:signal transduction histidine kinase
VVTVADSGIGIPAADLDQLFGRFFRASNATAAAIPGTGLGLAIVRQIVEGHEGQLTLESTEGEGTTVRIRLPLVTPDAADAAGNDEHVPAV